MSVKLLEVRLELRAVTNEMTELQAQLVRLELLAVTNEMPELQARLVKGYASLKVETLKIKLKELGASNVSGKKTELLERLVSVLL